MRNFVLLVAISALIGSAASANPQKDAKPKEPAKMIACAVEPEHKVDVKKATTEKMFADYKGNRYFFCCAGCPGKFKADPAKYVKAAHIKTPTASGKMKAKS
ncbi:MAG: YHS domain-containing protein [Capsulimonadales bacterium]|nr:YHS domain-containing protein [Capsulimonadales bacterium]